MLKSELWKSSLAFVVDTSLPCRWRRSAQHCAAVLLELFSGTGSIGAAFAERGWEVISLDIRDDFKPTLCLDLHDWGCKQYPRAISIACGAPRLARITRKQGLEARPREIWKLLIGLF